MPAENARFQDLTSDAVRGNKRLIGQLETLSDPFEVSLMVVEALAHGRHVAMNQHQVTRQTGDVFLE